MTEKSPLIESKPSVTAKMVCYMRALGYREMGAPVAQDHLAELFLSPSLRAQVQSDEIRPNLFKDPDMQMANYSYLTARTRHLDRIFSEALAANIEQVVVLGAGYDSRSYRFTDVPDGTQVYEVDAPTTQAAKLKYLGFADIAPPAHLHFVPINFNHEKIEDVLLKAGYDASLKTLFLWEGVTYYISAEAVDGTLAFIQQNAAPGSTVAFDYIYEPLARRDFRYYGSEQAFTVVEEYGEPFVFGIPENGIEAFLSERGFDLAEHYTPDQFQGRYLDDRFEPMYGFMVNAVATTR